MHVSLVRATINYKCDKILIVDFGTTKLYMVIAIRLHSVALFTKIGNDFENQYFPGVTIAWLSGLHLFQLQEGKSQGLAFKVT